MKIDFKNVYSFDWQDLFYIELENDIGIEAFKKLIVNQEQSFLSSKKEFEDYMEGELNSLPDGYKSGYYGQILHWDKLAIDELLKLQRYSTCVSIFSFFEGRLRRICELVETKYNFKVRVNDLNNNDNTIKYWNYLTKVFELESKKPEPFLTPIKQQKVIRNVITHQNGIPTDVQLKQIYQVVGLDIVDDNGIPVIVINNDYLYYILERTSLFLKAVLRSIDLRSNEIQNPFNPF